MQPKFLSQILGVLICLSGPLAAQSVELKGFHLEPDPDERAKALGDCLAGVADRCGPRVQLTARSIDRRSVQGLVDGAPPAQVNGLKPRLLVKDRTEDTPVGKATPLVSIDIEIFFDSNSATPSATSVPDMQALATAITDPRFSTKRFVILGHTDGRGSDAYNLDLSERRANSVRARLQSLSGLAADRFISAGRGEQELKDPTNPDSDVNRRVQIILLDS
ncbi:OmpA family protein [Antarctobacter heliothermus]|uniref:Outer membrane protein OmpA n=1 Tax=Antarctobacter heliothermus TaxID=74033 RepID=A0A239DG84_9RHOB|nr:OmpA family protein [Antarctobacter heliothermus]SNS30891.1 Outer membrane protein OmpA [Antarctobacter heliothermus]